MMHGAINVTEEELLVGLFQIVGPVANPSNADLSTLEGSLRSEADLPPPEKQSGNTRSHSALIGVSSRKPSLEAQLQPIKSSTARNWRESQSSW